MYHNGAHDAFTHPDPTQTPMSGMLYDWGKSVQCRGAQRGRQTDTWVLTVVFERQDPAIPEAMEASEFSFSLFEFGIWVTCNQRLLINTAPALC